MSIESKSSKSRTPSEQEEKSGKYGVLLHSSVLITLPLVHQFEYWRT
jgi:hypothetical protein